MDVILQLTPVMSLTLLILSLAVERLWTTLPSSPYFQGAWHTFVTFIIILIGGIIAFSMVWAEYMLIANTSALTFMVAGTFKEIVTVGAAVVFLHEPFTVINALGLVVLLIGVILFNFMKYKKLREGEIQPLSLTPRSPELKLSRSDGDLGLMPPHAEEDVPWRNSTYEAVNNGTDTLSDRGLASNGSDLNAADDAQTSSADGLNSEVELALGNPERRDGKVGVECDHKSV